MEELKARIELLKEQNPIKIQDLERKFGLLKFELQEAKKILERKEIALADVKGEWIKNNSEKKSRRNARRRAEPEDCQNELQCCGGENGYHEDRRFSAFLKVQLFV